MQGQEKLHTAEAEKLKDIKERLTLSRFRYTLGLI